MIEEELSLERRRRRPAGGIGTPVEHDEGAGTDLVPATHVDLGPGVEDGRAFERPADRFPAWREILGAVQEEFRRLGREGGHTQLLEEGPFYELVGTVTAGRPDWVKPVELQDLVSLLRRHMFGYQGLEQYLELDGVEEVYFNGYQQGFYIRHGKKLKITPPLFESKKDMRDLIDKVADQDGYSVDLSHPVLDATLTDEQGNVFARVNALIEPISRHGDSLVIRKHREIPFTLQGYIETGMISAQAAQELGDLVRQGARLIVSGGTASGKAHPLETPVLTPTGWRPIGELRVGDKVIGADGLPTAITGVFSQGEKEIWRVEFDDGASVECCDEHLWAVRTKKAKGRGQAFEIVSTADIRALEPWADNYRLFIPLVEPVQYATGPELPLDPYLLGVLLGDGGLTNSTPQVSSVDAEVLAGIRPLLPAGIELVRTGTATCDYRISGRIKGKANPVTGVIRELGLYGKRSEVKFIPAAYKTSSPEARLALLQGLCDTDGTVASATSAAFGSSSRQLALDVIEVARSLGGTPTMSVKDPSYEYKDEQLVGLPHYTVWLRLPKPLNPFRLSRKADELGFPRRGPTRAFTAIEPAGKREAVCISVAADDQLYVVKDFIVTHNTTLLNVLGNAFIPKDERIIVLEDTPELQIKTDDYEYLLTQKDATRDTGASEKEVTLRDLIRYCLRMRPDRIIVGEVRGQEAFDVLTAWNSGHEGSFLTVHANGAAEALSKLVQLAVSARQYDQDGVRDLIGRVVDVIVQVRLLKRGEGKGERRISEIVQVVHPDHITVELEPLVEQLLEQRKAKRIWDDVIVLTLWKLDAEGQMLKVADPLPTIGH